MVIKIIIKITIISFILLMRKEGSRDLNTHKMPIHDIKNIQHDASVHK